MGRTTADELLARLRTAGVSVWAEGEALRFRGPDQALTADVRESLREHKHSLLELLRAARARLSFGQQRLWFLDQLQPGSAAYNLPFRMRMRGPLDRDALERALAVIVERHEALRTTFAADHGEPVQTVQPPGHVQLPVVDLSALPPARREAEAGELARQAAEEPFDLTRDRMLRARLLRLDVDDNLLLLTIHHAAFDAWSLRVLCKELEALYPAFREGRPSPLPSLPLQFGEFAADQRRRLTGETLEKDLAYWRRRLAGSPPVLELPADRSRPPVRGREGGTVAATIPADLRTRLEALGRASGASLFMTLLAGFLVLLHRYSGQDDIVVGTPVANRVRSEAADMIGFFANTLPLRVDLSGEPGFRDLLRRVREACLGAYAHQEVPLERLLQELVPERNLSYTPLFQVVFTYQNAAAMSLRLPDLEIDLIEAWPGGAKFDLTAAFEERSGALHGSIEFSADLFERPTVERMARHLHNVLQAVANAPDQPISELDMAGPQEAARRRDAQPALPAPARTLHELVLAQAERTPDATALVHGGTRVTYAELTTRARRVASGLKTLGIGPETTVGVCLPRTPDLVVGLLAVLIAGGAYVPLDPAYPPQRLGLILEDSVSPVVLTQPALQDRLPASTSIQVHLDDLERRTTTTTRAPHPGPSEDNLAYVIYTSGSTGRPKGVAITHRSAVQLVAWGRQALTPDDLSGVLASTSICFDASVFELFTPLSTGGACILVDDALAVDRLAGPLPATLLCTVPSAAGELARLDRLPSSLRVANLGGEAVTPALVQRLHEAAPACRLQNLYGPTEDTTYSTMSVLDPDSPRPPAIGRPLPGTRAHILDGRLRPVPEGVAGELFLAGAGLSRGYNRRPGLTAERYLPDPFGPPGSRLYRTGDLVRLRPDGEIEFVGRRDHQVKIRGYRVEPGEIESVLQEHPAVHEAAVFTHRDRGDVALAAYAAAATGTTEDELRRHLKENLPRYMVPARVVILPQLPKTPSGKIDRSALPEPTPLPHGEDGNGAWTPVEELIAGAWREVLGLERVGAHDDFFALGGHSLRATQVLARLRSAFKVEIPLERMFAATTVAEQAALLVAEEPAPGHVARIAELRRRIDAMSDEEVRERLARGPQ